MKKHLLAATLGGTHHHTSMRAHTYPTHTPRNQRQLLQGRQRASNYVHVYVYNYCDQGEQQRGEQQQ